jgi:flagellar protein FlaG
MNPVNGLNRQLQTLADAASPAQTAPSMPAPSGAAPAVASSAAAQTSAQKAAPAPQTEPAIAVESIQELADRIGEQINIERRNLSFSIDDSTGNVVVQVIDAETDEVIRQVPSEEFQRLAQAMADLRGRLLDESSGLSQPGLLLSDRA